MLGFFAPRGVGMTAFPTNSATRTQIRRRFMLLGQTLEGMRVWDIRRAVQAVRAVKDFNNTPLWLEAVGTEGVNVLYASLFESNVAGLELSSLPESPDDAPDYLNVLCILDVPRAVEIAYIGLDIAGLVPISHPDLVFFGIEILFPARDRFMFQQLETIVDAVSAR